MEEDFETHVSIDVSANKPIASFPLPRPHNKITLNTCVEIIEAFRYFRSYPPVQKIFQCSSTLIKCVLSNREAIIKAHQEEHELSNEDLLNTKTTSGNDSNNKNKKSSDVTKTFQEISQNVRQKTKNSNDDDLSTTTHVTDVNNLQVNNNDASKDNTNDSLLIKSRKGTAKSLKKNSQKRKNAKDQIYPLTPQDSNDDTPYTLDLKNRVAVIRTYDFNMERNCKNFNKTKLANMFKCSRQEVELILLKRDSIIKEFDNLPKYTTFHWKKKKSTQKNGLAKVTHDLKSKIIERYKAGSNIEALAKMFNCNENRVLTIVEKVRKEETQRSEIEKIQYELADTLRLKGVDMNVTATDSVISSYEHVLKELKHVEEYAMLSENYSALSLLMQLQDHIQRKL